MDYSERVRQQIDQYKHVDNIHELPDIFHYWSNKYLRPRANEVLGVDSIVEFFCEDFRERLQTIADTRRLLSIGSGDCSLEISVALKLIESGTEDFVFECLDISPHLLEKGLKKANQLNLQNKFHFLETDINAWAASKNYCGVMANHSIHHVLNLEHLFENIKKSLHPKGIFLANDMIGRNGHMRWPEALKIVNMIWGFMPDRYKYNHQLKRFEQSYENLDSSSEGFEGIRSQDILPLLVKFFHFEKFLAAGNLVDTFIDRSFGHNFDTKNPEDTNFIDFLEFLNGILIDLGYLKPTLMLAVMSVSGNHTKVYRHWTPEYCVRDPDR